VVSIYGFQFALYYIMYLNEVIEGKRKATKQEVAITPKSKQKTSRE